MIDTLIGFGIGFYFGCFVGIYLAGLLIMAGRDDHEQP